MKILARRIARAGWWALTPWKYKTRLDYLRGRALARRQTRELADLARFESARCERHVAGLAPTHSMPWFDTEKLALLTGVPATKLRLSAPSTTGLQDVNGAAAFVLGIWRDRSDIRHLFPTLFRGDSDAFLAWLGRESQGGISLDASDWRLLQTLFASEFARRARQYFLAQPMVRELIPHGLTPPGMSSLFRWFARVGLRDAGLSIEEVIWLFLQAEQDPAYELLSAHAFTPAWQSLHPDGATVFGAKSFSLWFAQTYHAEGEWLNVERWLYLNSLEDQVRIGYCTHDAWRAKHPDAFSSIARAQGLLDWLSSLEGPIDWRARVWLSQRADSSTATNLCGLGMNVVGHFTYPSGLRVSVESLVQGAQSAGVALSLRDVRTDAKDDPFHALFYGAECHDVTVIHTQPYPYFNDVYSRADLEPRSPRTYRIAYWYWEFDSIPESWLQQAAQVDEVWTATEFVAKGLRERLSLPVRTLFPGVKLGPFKKRPRAYFGLDDGAYTFLFTFHMMSVMERKNPIGLIKAFRSAFAVEDPVRLVLKTSFGDRHPTQVHEMRDAAQGANIQIIDAVYSPDEVLSLMDACDVYVSLHRSEGLGLTMAEAMLLAKPVIATGYSGNVDFMNSHNSVLIPYTLCKVGRPIPPYDANSEWAEPSVDEAARAMRRMFDDQAWARELGRRGQVSALHSLSLEAAGRKVAARLSEIREWNQRN